MTTTFGDTRIDSVMCDDRLLTVMLKDGRVISNPVAWYPRLQQASPAQRQHWRVLPFGDAIHWEDIDEDISVHGMLQGIPAVRGRRARVDA